MASRGLGRRANGTVENGIEKKLRKGVGAVSDLINRVIVEHLLPMEILNTITNRFLSIKSFVEKKYIHILNQTY